jgi:hypothetical protein
MKKLSFLFIPLIALASCGGDSSSEDSAGEDSASSSKYFISVGDEIVETNKSMDVNYSSDGIKDETKFKIGSTTLEIFGFFSQLKQGPETTVGNSYGAIVTFSIPLEGDVTINSMERAGENSIGEDYDLTGDFVAKSGEKGSFSLSMFYMP